MCHIAGRGFLDLELSVTEMKNYVVIKVIWAFLHSVVSAPHLEQSSPTIGVQIDHVFYEWESHFLFYFD